MVKRRRTAVLTRSAFSIKQNSFMMDVSSNANDEKSSAVVLDNPCWGSPESCSLSDLLNLIRREECILLESQDFLVINKPPDLRMDGPYPATVHKLLTYWYPPPSLQAQAVVAARKDSRCFSGSSSRSCRDQYLVEAVSAVYKHNDIPDNELRPCHQLDYATSGVLLVARHADAANRARQLFEGRDSSLSKRYLALVRGHLTVDPSWPCRSVNDLESHLAVLEGNYRRRQKKKCHKPHTFQGYQPAHSVFQIWLQQVGKGKPRHERFTDEQWDAIWKPLDSTNLKNRLIEQPTIKWADLKCNSSYTSSFERAADTYNDFLRQRQYEHTANLASKEAAALPPFFRDEQNHMYVYVPLAEHPKDFAMRVPSRWNACLPEFGSIAQNTQPVNLSCVPTGDESLDYKPALTKCTLVSHSYLPNGSDPPLPVTKVWLEPRTGRRHQLRVHVALLGHSIVGDHTYDRQGDNNDKRRGGCPRMCLHAAQLQFPGLDVTAPDPFVEDGQQIRVQVLH